MSHEPITVTVDPTKAPVTIEPTDDGVYLLDEHGHARLVYTNDQDVFPWQLDLTANAPGKPVGVFNNEWVDQAWGATPQDAIDQARRLLVEAYGPAFRALGLMTTTSLAPVFADNTRAALDALISLGTDSKATSLPEALAEMELVQAPPPTPEQRRAMVEELVAAADGLVECGSNCMEAIWAQSTRDQPQQRQAELDQARADFRALAEKLMGVTK